MSKTQSSEQDFSLDCFFIEGNNFASVWHVESINKHIEGGNSSYYFVDVNKGEVPFNQLNKQSKFYFDNNALIDFISNDNRRLVKPRKIEFVPFARENKSSIEIGPAAIENILSQNGRVKLCGRSLKNIYKSFYRGLIGDCCSSQLEARAGRDAKKALYEWNLNNRNYYYNYSCMLFLSNLLIDDKKIN